MGAKRKCPRIITEWYPLFPEAVEAREDLDDLESEDDED